MKHPDQEAVQKDLEALSLGNLKTVEFDITLPRQGKNGSVITWESADPRWIDEEGRVNRPEYGRGTRTIVLTATAKKGDAAGERRFDVTILEQANLIKIEKVFPVHLVRQVNVRFYLPSAVALKTREQEVFSYLAEWQGGEERVYSQTGEYTVIGRIKDTDYSFIGVISVVDHLENVTEERPRAVPAAVGDAVLTGDSVFKRNQENRLAYLLSADDDQMLYNFRQAAGLDTMGAPEMIGWDSPKALLRGHTTGHYLSGLSFCYAATGNKTILKKLNYVVEELAKVQNAFEASGNTHPGFLSGYSEEQFDLLEEYVPYPQIWAPYYTLHKIFAGLLDAYRLVGNELALSVADRLGDWVYERLSRLPHEKLKKMWSIYIAGEFGGINESLAQLYLYTRKEAHIQAAKLFDNDRLFYPLEQRVDALGAMHANQHIPQMIGALRIYDATHEKKYYEISKYFWEIVTGRHIYSIGGTGDQEMFRQPGRIAGFLSDSTAETCASYNMLKLTRDLFAYEQKAELMDYYERAMVNHIAATSDHCHSNGSQYFMPTAPGSHKTFLDENSCCQGTGLENHFKYLEAAYYLTEETLFVNLYLDSLLKNSEKGIELQQNQTETDLEHVTLTFRRIPRMQVKLRVPYWTAGNPQVSINGRPLQTEIVDGYITLSRLLRPGDTVSLYFPAEFRFEAAPDDPCVGSLAYGPYVLAAKSDQTDFLVLDGPTVAGRFVREENSLTWRDPETGLTFVPLYQINEEPYHPYLKMKSV